MSLLLNLVISFLGFTISPARVEKALLNAAKITEVFEVENFSNDSLRIKVEFEDFLINELGKVLFLAPGGLSNSVAPHTIINPEEFFIPSQGHEFVRVTFTMPKDSMIPEYYSMLLFKSKPIPTKYQPMIAVVGEIGVPIYYSFANLMTKDASIENLNVSKDTIKITLKNNGNVHLRITGKAKVLKGKDIIAADTIPEFVILPKKVRKINLPLLKPLEKGNYIARVTFDYGGIELIEGERGFTR